MAEAYTVTPTCVKLITVNSQQIDDHTNFRGSTDITTKLRNVCIPLLVTHMLMLLGAFLNLKIKYTTCLRVGGGGSWNRLQRQQNSLVFVTYFCSMVYSTL
jgi:hypothetical protein